MKTKDVKKMERPIDRLAYWIQERESIRLKREAGEKKPWTDDEVLQKYRFCNVRRMDDKVSKWLYENWYQPHFDYPNMLVACALARFINLPESLELIGFPLTFGASRIKRKVRQRKESGENVFNGAYIVSGKSGRDKIESVVDYYVKPLHANKLQKKIDTDSMEETHALIQGCFGFGSFMAGQVTADLRWALSGSWSDRNSWAPIGPGSRRGMNRLLESVVNTPIPQVDFDTLLTRLIADLSVALPDNIGERLEAMDYQNCLCEFDKYERTLFEGRRPKAIFRSEV